MNQLIVKTFVEILRPNPMPFLAPTKDYLEVPSRDVEYVRRLDETKGAIGFMFFDRTTLTLDDGEVLSGELRNESKGYIFGRVKTMLEVGAMSEEELGMPPKAITDRMKEEGVERIVIMRDGNITPIKPEDEANIEFVEDSDIVLA